LLLRMAQSALRGTKEEDRLSSVFIFGAGASYGSGPCYPSPPPLGKDLFSALAKEGGVAGSVSTELATLFSVDFEAGMDVFWKERNVATTALLREMAKYFVRFEPLPGNCYSQLLKVLDGTRKKAVLVTTNYDLLIEHAITRAGLKVSYAGLPAPPDNVVVLKIHGSCNFLPDLQPRQISGFLFDHSATEDGAIIENDVKVATSTQQILEFCDTEDSIAPALAMYAPSKRVLYCQGFVKAQQEAWAQAANHASRIFIVGLRVHPVDEHIWGVLARCAAPLYYVGFEPNEFATWAETLRRKGAYVLSKSFADALPRIASQLGN
jgi:hypothetical protein